MYPSCHGHRCRRSHLAVGLPLLLLLLASAARSGPAAELPRPEELGPLARAQYDLLVVRQCGLLSAEVRRGFDLLEADLVRERGGGADAETLERARHAGLLAFDREWGNRGLGGTRPWCRADGKAAALAFFARYIDDRFALPALRP